MGLIGALGLLATTYASLARIWPRAFPGVSGRPVTLRLALSVVLPCALLVWAGWNLWKLRRIAAIAIGLVISAAVLAHYAGLNASEAMPADLLMLGLIGVGWKELN